MAQNVAIVTDATIDLTRERGDEMGIEVGSVTYVIDGVSWSIHPDMDALAFIDSVDRRTQRASSAGVNAEEFTRCYEAALGRAPEVLCITMPRKISSTWTFAVTAADLFDPGQIEVFDSRQVHVGQTALVLEAARAARAGATRARIVAALGRAVEHSASYMAGASFGVLEDIGRLKGKGEDMRGRYSIQRVGDNEFRAHATADSWQDAVACILDGIDHDTPPGAPLSAVISRIGVEPAEAALREGILARHPGSVVEVCTDRPNVAFFGGGSGSFAVGFSPVLAL